MSESEKKEYREGGRRVFKEFFFKITFAAATWTTNDLGFTGRA